MAISLTCQSCGLESLQRLILPLALLLLQCRAKCPKFVHLSSLLNLSGHTHVKIVLWPAVLIKHINVEPKKHEIMKKCLGQPERNQFFTLGIKCLSSSGVCLSSMKVLHEDQSSYRVPDTQSPTRHWPLVFAVGLIELAQR